MMHPISICVFLFGLIYWCVPAKGLILRNTCRNILSSLLTGKCWRRFHKKNLELKNSDNTWSVNANRIIHCFSPMQMQGKKQKHVTIHLLKTACFRSGILPFIHVICKYIPLTFSFVLLFFLKQYHQVLQYQHL